MCTAISASIDTGSSFPRMKPGRDSPHTSRWPWKGGDRPRPSRGRGTRWRWSLKVADAAGCHHTEAYESLARVVRDFTGERGEASAEGLLSFVRRPRGL
jgi:hypothetical protein